MEKGKERNLKRTEGNEEKRRDGERKDGDIK